MRSSDDRTILPFRNVFTPTFLERLGERDEPPTAGEADVAGPWRVEEIPGGFGVFRVGETAARGFPPYAFFTARPLALWPPPSSPAPDGKRPSVSRKKPDLPATPSPNAAGKRWATFNSSTRSWSTD